MAVRASARPEAISSRVVQVIQKAEGQEIRVAVLTLPNGRRLGDVRLFCRNQAAGGAITPTRRGVCFSPESLPELQSALVELERAIQAP